MIESSIIGSAGQEIVYAGRTGNANAHVRVLKVMRWGVHKGHRNALLKTTHSRYNFSSRELPGPEGCAGADLLEVKNRATSRSNLWGLLLICVKSKVYVI